MEATIERLRRFLKHAPAAKGESAVAGWTVDGVSVCGQCAGRILDRGCKMGDKVDPVWDGPITCALCA